MTDTKHGWVTPRADGARARCGGPGVCATCDTEAMHEAMLTGVFGVVPQAGRAAAPCKTCNDQGAVGNVLNAEPCPDCSPASVAPGDAQDEQPKRNGCGSVSFKLSDGSAVSCDWSAHEWELSIPATRHERDIAFKELLQEIGRLRALGAAPAAGDARFPLPAKMPEFEGAGDEYPSNESYQEGYTEGWNAAIDAARAAQVPQQGEA